MLSPRGKQKKERSKDSGKEKTSSRSRRKARVMLGTNRKKPSPLSLAPSEKHSTLSEEMICCSVEMLLSAGALNESGIFRVSGSREKTNELYSIMIENDVGKFQTYCTTQSLTSAPLIVAGAFKRYLRQCDEPTIPFRCYKDLLHIEQNQTPSERLKALKQYCAPEADNIPEKTRQLLNVIIPFLHRIAANASVNKMDLENLARIFSPSIIRNYPDIQLLDLNAVNSEIALFRDFLNWFDFIFLNATGVNLKAQDKAFDRNRKRQTMNLMKHAEVAEKFLILDNRKKTSVFDDDDDDEVSSPSSPRITFASSSNNSGSSSGISSPRNFQLASPRNNNNSSSSSSSSNNISSPRNFQPASPRNNNESSFIPKSPRKSPQTNGGTRIGHLQISASRGNLLSKHSQTFKVQFGEITCRRTYDDFAAFHHFLKCNYKNIDNFPPLPSKMSASHKKEMAAGLSAFLFFVISRDELFMDSLFIQRWLEFIGEKKKLEKFSSLNGASSSSGSSGIEATDDSIRKWSYTKN